jgi:hypothetical protein
MRPKVLAQSLHRDGGGGVKIARLVQQNEHRNLAATLKVARHAANGCNEVLDAHGATQWRS